jgi:LysR family transcriptional activator of glutamate synthase operon
MTLLSYAHGMDLRQLSYVVLLSEERNFTRAAARANVAQPALSRQIQNLERELGVSLVDRTTRRVALTDDGLVLVGHARRVLAELDAIRISMDSSAAVLRGRVTLGVTPTPGPVDVPRLLAAFNELHPQVELAVREDLSVRLTDQLRADEIDLAFVSAVGAPQRRGLELTRVADDPLLLVVSPTHHLARATSVRMTELRDESFIMFRAPSTIRKMIVEACEAAGFVPRDQFETGDPWQAMRLADAGLGIAFLPQHDIEQRQQAVASVRLHDPSMRYEVFLARREARQLSPAAAQLMREALESLTF